MKKDESSMMTVVLKSKALSIWNHDKGPVFWYAAGVPGPFYLNTEQMVGKELSDTLLKRITSIIETQHDVAARALELEKLIMDACVETPVYQSIIDALVEKTKAVFDTKSYALISGGERRDFLFSIPVARALGLRHLYLFKDNRHYCSANIQRGEHCLHVADLINNAASYFDKWLPMLADAGLIFAGTLCVNTRGGNGIKRLTEAGYKLAALNGVDLEFFTKSLEMGLIDRATCDEIALFFKSPQEWASTYLMTNVAIYDLPHLDRKSFERLHSFFRTDPWALRQAHQGFFAEMDKAIAARLSAGV